MMSLPLRWFGWWCLLAPLAMHPASGQTSGAPGGGADDCRTNAVVILHADRSFTNRCPGVRYVVQKAYFERILSGYRSGQDTVPMVEQALAERDSLVRLLNEKDAVLDSTRHALVRLSGVLTDESVRALTAARDTLNRAVLPELRAVRQDLADASDDLKDAERRLFWARIKFAALPALAGVAVGFLLGR